MDTTETISYEKKSRRNISDDFEHIYLGGNWLGKHITPNPHAVTLTEDYKRVIKYISKYLYDHNTYTFGLGGFDRDDVHSLCMTFGHAFFSLESNRKWTEFKKISSLLQYFITQRVVAVTNKINNKFQEKEIIALDVSVDECAWRSQYEYLDNTDSEYVEEQSQPIISYNEEENEEDDFLDFDSINDEEEVEEDDIDINMYDYMPTTSEIKPRDKHYIASKINEIAKNPEKYADELARYATSKYVAESIRKAARKICKQYKINPNQWATKQIENGASRHEFELDSKVQ